MILTQQALFFMAIFSMTIESSCSLIVNRFIRAWNGYHYVLNNWEPISRLIIPCGQYPKYHQNARHNLIYTVSLELFVSQNSPSFVQVGTDNIDYYRNWYIDDCIAEWSIKFIHNPAVHYIRLSSGPRIGPLAQCNHLDALPELSKLRRYLTELSSIWCLYPLDVHTTLYCLIAI